MTKTATKTKRNNKKGKIDIAKSFKEIYHENIYLGYNLKVEKSLNNFSKEKLFDNPHFVCILCGDGFLLKSDYDNHYATHFDVPTYFECEKCGEIFRKSKEVIIHKKRIHTEKKQHFCKICKEFYSTKKELILHKKQKHSKKKEHLCAVCKKFYQTRESLKHHTKYKHPAVFQSIWNCGFCSMSFSKRCELRAHENNAHQINDLSVKKTKSETKVTLKTNNVASNNNLLNNDEIIIPSIQTDAMIQAKISGGIPFVTIHFIKGIPILGRATDNGIECKIRPAHHFDFVALTRSSSHGLDFQTIEIVAALYQIVNTNGDYDFHVLPPASIQDIIGEDSTLSIRYDVYAGLSLRDSIFNTHIEPIENNDKQRLPTVALKNNPEFDTTISSVSTEVFQNIALGNLLSPTRVESQENLLNNDIDIEEDNNQYFSLQNINDSENINFQNNEIHNFQLQSNESSNVVECNKIEGLEFQISELGSNSFNEFGYEDIKNEDFNFQINEDYYPNFEFGAFEEVETENN